MAFRKDFKDGMAAYKQSLRFIRKHGFWKYFILPAFLSLFLVTLVVFLAVQFTPDLINWLSLKIGYENWAFRGSGVLGKVFDGLFGLIFIGIVVFGYYFTYKYIILTILGPYLGYVSEKTESIINGKEYEFDWGQFAKDLWRGVKMSLRNIVREVGLSLLIILIGFIPVIGIISPVLLFIVASYFVGFSMMDYYYERQRLTVRESADKITQQRGFVMAIGAGFSLLMFIPVFGVMFAPVISIVAATIGTVKREEKKLNP